MDAAEAAALLPLRIVDARVVGSAYRQSSTFYAIQVHTSRGEHTRHRRFSEFIACASRMSAALSTSTESREATPRRRGGELR